MCFSRIVITCYSIPTLPLLNKYKPPPPHPPSPKPHAAPGSTHSPHYRYPHASREELLLHPCPYIVGLSTLLIPNQYQPRLIISLPLIPIPHESVQQHIVTIRNPFIPTPSSPVWRLHAAANNGIICETGKIFRFLPRLCALDVPALD